jgi:hypothetical protein
VIIYRLVGFGNITIDTTTTTATATTITTTNNIDLYIITTITTIIIISNSAEEVREVADECGGAARGEEAADGGAIGVEATLELEALGEARRSHQRARISAYALTD